MGKFGRFILFFWLIFIQIFDIVQNAESGQGQLFINVLHTFPLISNYYNFFNITIDQSDSSTELISINGEVQIYNIHQFDHSQFDWAVYNQHLYEQNKQCYLKNIVQFIEESRICRNYQSCDIDWKLRQQNLTLKVNELQEISQDKKSYVTLLLDNSKFPCNGTYYPSMNLAFETNLLFTFSYTYFFLYNALILVIATIFLVLISGIILIYFKYRKQKRKNQQFLDRQKMVQQSEKYMSQNQQKQKQQMQQIQQQQLKSSQLQQQQQQQNGNDSVFIQTQNVKQSNYMPPTYEQKKQIYQSFQQNGPDSLVGFRGQSSHGNSLVNNTLIKKYNLNNNVNSEMDQNYY